MKTSTKIAGLFAAVMIAASGSVTAAEVANPYVQSSGKVLMSGYGLCWRTSYWTPALAEALGPQGAGCQCDKAILSASACEAPAAAAPAVAGNTKEKVTLSADALFDFNSDKLKPEGMAKLDDLVASLAGVDVEVITSTGYTDRLGKEVYNQKLSERRANAVKTYLVNKGVSEGSIETIGRGAADPVVSCPNPSKNGEIKNFKQLIGCLQPNRRAVIEVSGSRSAQ